MIGPSGVHALIGPREPVEALLKVLRLDEGVLRMWPETGVHPYDILELVAALRTQTPCLIVTLSPLVINELEADEVSVITRDAGGCLLITPLKQTPHYADRRKVYENGELWLAHPDVEGREG